MGSLGGEVAEFELVGDGEELVGMLIWGEHRWRIGVSIVQMGKESSGNRVVLPVERLEELWPYGAGKRVGAVLHGASVLADLRATLDELERLAGRGLFELRALFGPQHGFGGTTQDNMIEWDGFRHERLGVPVFSLYGEHREPTAGMLSGLDVLLVDLQDVGARYYTFIWTLFLCMRACEKSGVAVVVCDRPNPINGTDVEGEVQGEGYLSFVGLRPIPVRHGRTIGELARGFQESCFPDLTLQVLPMTGWQRAMWWDGTGLPWVMPSPNMPTLETATVYPGMCLLEGTNVSEGRGTTRPFEYFGAPWCDGRVLCGELNRRGLPGCFFREVEFEPTFHNYAGEVCHGAQLHVTEREEFEPVRAGLEVVGAMRGMWPEDFRWKRPPYEYEYEKLPIEILLGGPVGVFFERNS